MSKLPTRESRLWKYLRDGMGNRWQANRIESSTSVGIPDVEFAVFGASGWLELKTLDEFPKRDTTNVRIPHFTPEQRLWFRNRAKYKHDCFLMVRVGSEHFLFAGYQLPLIGETTAEGWRKQAIRYWPDKVDFDDLAICLEVTW